MAVAAHRFLRMMGLTTALVLAATSCARTDPPQPTRVSDTLPKIIARVNGVNIEREAVLARLDQARAMMVHQQHMAQMASADSGDKADAAATPAAAASTPAQQAQHEVQQEKELLHTIINQMVLEELKKQEAARLGLSISTEQLEANAKRIEAQSGSPEALQEQLRQGHTTVEQWQAQLRQALLFQQLENRRRTAVPVSDEEMRQYWAQNHATLAKLWQTDRFDQVRDRLRVMIQQSRWPTEEARWYQDLVRSAKIWVDPGVRQRLAKPADHAHPGAQSPSVQPDAPKG